MSKHTPGPWKAESDEHGHWVCLPGKDTFVCEIANEVSFDEVGANARLIAASPRMGEILQRAREKIRRCGGYSICGDPDERQALINDMDEVLVDAGLDEPGSVD